jgi:hypothetical protein
VLQVDRATGARTPVLSDLGFGAGLEFDAAGDLIVQDADATSFLGRLQRVPITETSGELVFGAPVPLVGDMQSGYGLAIDGDGNFFTTGGGGLFRVAGSPLVETSFDANGFSTAIAFDPGSLPFEAWAGPAGGRLAFTANAGADTFVTLLTPAQPGDYNADGQVDENDYMTWRVAFGSAEPTADGNGDGRVDAADYVIWRKNSVAAAMTSSATLPLRVPEPMTVGMAVFGLAALLINCARRRR